MDPGLRLSADMGPATSADVRDMQDVPYGQAVGSLFYLAVATRPDIARTVGNLARFSKNPGMTHWKAVKHLFRYIKGTLDYKLTYSSSSDSELFTSYTDADHAGCPDTGRSTSGYVIKMGTGAISWSSRLQSIVALSTTEAEFVAAVSAGQEMLWLRNLLTEFRFDVSAASRLSICARWTCQRTFSQSPWLSQRCWRWSRCSGWGLDRSGGSVELGGFGRVPVPVSSLDLFPKTLTLRTYTLLHH